MATKVEIKSSNQSVTMLLRRHVSMLDGGAANDDVVHDVANDDVVHAVANDVANDVTRQASAPTRDEGVDVDASSARPPRVRRSTGAKPTGRLMVANDGPATVRSESRGVGRDARSALDGTSDRALDGARDGALDGSSDRASDGAFEGASEGAIDIAPPWLRRVGLINDYVRVPYANGSSFASQFLFRELRARGQEVTVIGPRDPDARPEELPPRYVELPSLPLRNHPGVHLAMPSRSSLEELARREFDLVLGQTSNALMDAGVWLRTTRGVPLVLVNTVHLPSVYNTVLPERLNRYAMVHEVFREAVVPFAEAQTVDAYNRSDGLVVLSPGLEAYWRERGVEVPIHVIPRAIEPKIFSAMPGADPFHPRAPRGGRLLVVCRHVREKNVQRLLALFARHVVPACPNATLTLVGDGPDHALFVRAAAELGLAERTFFVGEQGLVSMPTWYAHADLFVYASLSETYGQVITEASWCGLPSVAFADAMGVSGQIASGVDGELVPPGPNEAEADADFGARVVRLLREPARRRAYAEEAMRRARLRADPKRCVARYYDAFDVARGHASRTFVARSRPRELRLLGRWTGVHAVALGLGLLRAPAVLNRNGAATPSWTLG